MTRIYILLSAILLSALWGCKAKKELTQNESTTSSTVGNNLNELGEKCVDGVHDIIWTPIDKRKVEIDTKDFAGFTTDVNLIRNLLIKGFENGQPFTLSLPLYVNQQVECFTFELQESGTMSREDQKKTGILSFRAFDQNNPGNTARIDYYFERGLRVYANIGENSVFLEPMAKQKMIYISFDKNASPGLKEQFEILD